jgi:uncharacterized membrane protein
MPSALGCGMNRLRSFWLTLRGSLWFVPSLLLLLGVGAALLMIELQPLVDRDIARDWPRVFGAGAEGARGMLSAIATSMITVAGVVFSVTIVALSLTASQYSPRVLRNFMSDHSTQVVLGAFVAVFAYCLIVLRTIRGGDEGGFVPSLAVLGGVFMAFIGIGLLIFFVHHVATAIQVAYIVKRIATDTGEAIDRLFPAEVGDELPTEGPLTPSAPHHDAWQSVPARRTGYLVGIDAEALMTWAAEHRTVLRVLPRVGDFVVAGMAVVKMAPGGAPAQDKACRVLLDSFTLQDQRNVDQDAAYGLQQLVDVALKALSPSVHDPSTAVSCVDHLGALLRRLSSRRIEGGLREHEGHLRLIVAAPVYQDLVHVALVALRHNAGGHEAVHVRLLAAVENAADATDDPHRLAVLAQQVEAHLARLAECDLPDDRRPALRTRAEALRHELAQRSRLPRRRPHEERGLPRSMATEEPT